MNQFEQLAERTIASMGDVFHDANYYPVTECHECGARLCYTGAPGDGACPACHTHIGSPGERQHQQIAEALTEAFEQIAHKPQCPFCHEYTTPAEPKLKTDTRTFLCQCGAAATLNFHPPISTESKERARKKPGPRPDLALRTSILNYIVEHKKANDGLSPSRRSIQQDLDVASVNTVHNHIVALEQQGVIKRHGRGIIVHAGRWTHTDEKTPPACNSCKCEMKADLLSLGLERDSGYRYKCIACGATTSILHSGPGHKPPPLVGRIPDTIAEERREKYSLLDVTLNGKPAAIKGFRLHFAQIVELDAHGPCVEFTWDAVARIVEKGGNFES
jgi:DNA-binding transcriptional regulator YhcF (GntR family)